MALRPVFLVKNDYIAKKNINFEWNPGFSIKQKQKCIKALHNSFYEKFQNYNVLEISTKSPKKIGKKLSAFNLKLNYKENSYTVEKIFQSSKVFENGGPFKDILKKSSKEAKKDKRLNNSGDLISFKYKGEKWPLNPKTLFYDWIYINALNQNKDLSNKLMTYNAFTDIEFNPKKSINCQAKSAAFFVSLKKQKLLKNVLTDRDFYKKIHCKYDKKFNNTLF